MKKALILGINSSLGQAIAEELIKERYEIIGTKRITSEIDKKFEDKLLKVINLDISSIENIDLLFNLIKDEKFDFVASAISNKPTLNKFENISIETFKKDLDINVLNHIYFFKKIIPQMSKDSNMIFILSEMVFNDRLKYASSYQISKYALLGLMTVLSQELKTKGIRVNAISPGMMDTNFIKNVPSIVKESYIMKYSKNEFIKPKDVARKIVQMINDETLNGQNIPFFEK